MIYKLKNPVKKYDWGSRSLIKRYFGMVNKDIVAEIWMGAHPLSSSTINFQGEDTSLFEYIQKNPSSIEEKVYNKYKNLPYLFKILSSAKALSIQVHPSIKQAKMGFKKENEQGIQLSAPNRMYKDENHKPETIVALSDFYALKGFRDLESIRDDFENIGISHLFSTDYKTLFSNVTNCTEEDLESVLYYSKDNQELRFDWINKLFSQYNYDRGVLAPLYLNTIHLKPFEGLYLPSGVLHAYLHGLGVELMANSDNVLRAGCTSKHVDVKELESVVKFEKDDLKILKVKDNKYESLSDEFCLYFHEGRYNMQITCGSCILLNVGDVFKIGSMTIDKGESIFCTKDLRSLVIHGTNIKIFIARVNS